jgi:hypothetical protein
MNDYVYQEYPKMLYRKGTAMQYEGKNLDTRIVNSREEEKAAKGWVDHPSKVRDSKTAKWLKTRFKPWWLEWKWLVGPVLGGLLALAVAIAKH